MSEWGASPARGSRGEAGARGHHTRMASDKPGTVAKHPAELSGYPVVETLAPDACYLAIGPGGRGVALKKLDPDCLLGRLLHPDVRDRMSRVRELAHTGVANFYGVGKEVDEAWLIWEYVQGKPFADYATDHCRTPRDLVLLTRELVLTVESLHTQGIVHGSITSGNVIVAPGGTIRLTHVSPLLYTDPADDAEALADMLDGVLEERGERAGPLGRLMAEARHAQMPLRVLAARLATLADARDPANGFAGSAGGSSGSSSRRERRTRRRALLGALVVALAGLAVAYGVWHYAGGPKPAEVLPKLLPGR